MRSLISALALMLALGALAQDGTLETEVRNLIESGQPRDAVELIEERSSEAERSADLWYLLSEAHHAVMDDVSWIKKRGPAKKMKRCLEAALERDASHAKARRELADYYHYAPWIVGGDEDEAQRHLDLLEQAAPGEGWAARAQWARDAGNKDEAAAHYRKALEFGPREPKWLLVLAVLEQQESRYEASVELLDEAIEAGTDLEQVYYYRARASALAGLDLEHGLDCAAHYLAHCAKCDDDDRAHGWWRQATILKRLERKDEAVAAYEEALRLKPDLEGAEQGLKELRP